MPMSFRHLSAVLLALIVTGAGPALSSPNPASSTLSPDDNRIVQFDLGNNHSCAVVRSGALLCWGDNGEGQIGTGKVGGTVSKPVRVIEAGVTAVAAGGANTCAVVSGALRCWGSNREGQVGTGVASLPVASPTQVLASAWVRPPRRRSPRLKSPRSRTSVRL